MNIGQAAKASGVSAKMIRYYESIGLLPEADRRQSGYRDYGPPDLHRLTFVRRARDLGFSMIQIKALLSLWSDANRPAADIRAVASAHVAELEEQAFKLQEVIATLRHLIDACEREDDRPHCPIISTLGGGLAKDPAPQAAKGNGARRTSRPRPAAS